MFLLRRPALIFKCLLLGIVIWCFIAFVISYNDFSSINNFINTDPLQEGHSDHFRIDNDIEDILPQPEKLAKEQENDDETQVIAKPIKYMEPNTMNLNDTIKLQNMASVDVITQRHPTDLGDIIKSDNNLWKLNPEEFGVLPELLHGDGPGEMGKPVILPQNLTRDVEELVAQGWKNCGYNQYVGDMISLRRTLFDPQDEACKASENYLPMDRLSKTSIIIIFYNEAWSTLLRTVHSIFDRTPPQLVQEIILVDDGSDREHLKEPLDNYMAKFPKVKIVRVFPRGGLIRARLHGTAAAKGPILTFLDSHCECAEGWLVPLLDRVVRNKTTVACPIIDIIDDNTFEYKKKDVLDIGGFNWNVQFIWLYLSDARKKEIKNPIDPRRTPTMVGGLFSINKEYFEYLGTYDDAFNTWGGENLELSFKTWMCGGTVEMLPCSRVGHIFRIQSPYTLMGGTSTARKNSYRVAEVWMDEYAKYFYQSEKFYKPDYGDVSERKALRQKLQCKSFDWYIKNVFPELFVPGEAVAFGEIRNEGSDMCLEYSSNNYSLGIHQCNYDNSEQFFIYTHKGEIYRDQSCIDYFMGAIHMNDCHGQQGNQHWQYIPSKNLVLHFYTGLCLTISDKGDTLSMENCNETEPKQQWRMQNYNYKSADWYKKSFGQ